MSQTVNLRYFAAVREAAGVETEIREAPSVQAALEQASAQHGAEFQRLIGISSLLLNGVSLIKEETTTPLEGEANVDVLPPFAGG